MSYRPLKQDAVGRDIGQYPPDVRSVDWWGVIMLTVVLLAFFASLMFTWFFLRFGSDAWPPEGTSAPDIVLPTLSTLVLLASVVPLLWLQSQLRKQRMPRFNLGLGLHAGLGVLFLVIQGVHYLLLDFSGTDHAYGSAFYVITGFHAVLVFSGLYAGAIVQARAWKGHFDTQHHVAISCLATYWYALIAMWLVIYPSLYLLTYIE